MRYFWRLALAIMFAGGMINSVQAGEAANQCLNNCDSSYQSSQQYCLTNPYCIADAEQQQYSCYDFCNYEFGPANRMRCYTDHYGYYQCYQIDY